MARNQYPHWLLCFLKAVDISPEETLYRLLNMAEFHFMHSGVLDPLGLLSASCCQWGFQVLKCCCTAPRVIEVLLNTYDRLKITDSWAEAIPPDVFKVGLDILYVWTSVTYITSDERMLKLELLTHIILYSALFYNQF